MSAADEGTPGFAPGFGRIEPRRHVAQHGLRDFSRFGYTDALFPGMTGGDD